MKAETLRKRLDRNRPMTSVTIRMPEDVVEDLKRLAPQLGFSGYQPLVRAYVGQAMREDLKRLEKDKLAALVESLKRRGVSEKLIVSALEDAEGESAA
jgi:putative aminopeptidase FrvX